MFSSANPADPANEKMSEARPQPLAYTVADAMAATGLGRSLIFELMAEGKLRRVKIGRKTLIPADSLRALVTGNAA